MGTKFSEWNIIWIIHIFTTMEALRGLVPKSGIVLLKPASAVYLGSNVSIICVATRDPCNGRGEFLFRLNRTTRQPDRGNHTSSMLQLFSVTESHHVICHLECDRWKHLVDVVWLRVGYPPDPPRHVKCSLDESSTEMRCEWDPGRETRLPTNYSVLARNLQTGQEATVRGEAAAVTIPVNRTENGTYTIQITAANQLSHSESAVVLVQLADIVVPVTPVITKIDVLVSNFVISINWRNQTSENLRYCELEYSKLREPTWTLVGEKINKNNCLSIGKIQNAHSLRVRCREETGSSYWSKWSDPYVMPPSAPEDNPNVWRVLGPDYPDGSQEISILISPDPDELPQRRITGYKVFYLHRGIESVLRDCSPSGIQCVAVLPKGVKTVFISSYNRYGTSPASEIPVWENAESGTQNLTVSSGLLTSMPVQWQHPCCSGDNLRSFILQWSPDSCDGKQKTISWQKVEKEETNFTINEPKTGPKLEKDARRIWWDEIPLCDRRGFITEYTLHLESNGLQTKSKLPESTRHFALDRLDPSELYSVCISASTSAGDGPADHCTLIHPDNSLHSYIGLLLGIGVGAIALTILFLNVSTIGERLKTAVMVFLPKYLHEEFPRVDNSKALKALQANREDAEPTSCPTYSDPEITEVQELISYPVPMAEAFEVAEETAAEDEPLLTHPTNDELPEQTLGYRPQLAEPKIQRNDSYCSPTHMLDIQRVTQRLESPRLTSDMKENTVLWDSGAEMDLNVFKAIKLLQIDGIDQNKDSGPLQAAANDNSRRIHRENPVETQTVPTDQLICTLPGGLKEFTDVHSYFPQIFAKGK
ncbi:interleukin-23 receptor isoform X2 [Pseudophryne corroboree]|uniref:interleukin-23 receptor isoform X2 n=1 Tax=Pseudophryne corroboree TaxID=495146 RepID=UPI003081B35C